MKLGAPALITTCALLALASCRSPYDDEGEGPYNPSDSGYYGYTLKPDLAYGPYRQPRSYGPSYREHYYTHYGRYGRYDPYRYGYGGYGHHGYRGHGYGRHSHGGHGYGGYGFGHHSPY